MDQVTTLLAPQPSAVMATLYIVQGHDCSMLLVEDCRDLRIWGRLAEGFVQAVSDARAIGLLKPTDQLAQHASEQPFLKVGVVPCSKEAFRYLQPYHYFREGITIFPN